MTPPKSRSRIRGLLKSIRDANQPVKPVLRKTPSKKAAIPNGPDTEFVLSVVIPALSGDPVPPVLKV